jgi:hypothetical protein
VVTEKRCLLPTLKPGDPDNATVTHALNQKSAT